jgi:hypothetical protein
MLLEIWIFCNGQPDCDDDRRIYVAHRIYPNELEKKDTTDIQMSASYIDLHH